MDMAESGVSRPGFHCQEAPSLATPDSSLHVGGVSLYRLGILCRLCLP